MASNHGVVYLGPGKVEVRSIDYPELKTPHPSKRRYRTETFCYGPRSCPLYESGLARKVPGRRGMTYTEEDWVDIEATSHRRLDE